MGGVSSQLLLAASSNRNRPVNFSMSGAAGLFHVCSAELWRRSIVSVLESLQAVRKFDADI